MATQFKLRRDTAANWTSANPTLAAGEPGVETDTLKFKIGNGATPWTSLSYAPGAIDAALITSGTLPLTRGGTGQTSFTSGFVKSNGTTLSGGNAVTAADISSTEQASVVAGKVRSGGVVAGTPVVIHTGATTPTPVAGAINLWFN